MDKIEVRYGGHRITNGVVYIDREACRGYQITVEYDNGNIIETILRDEELEILDNVRGMVKKEN